MGKGPPKKYALSNTRQAHPLSNKDNNLLHLHLYLHHLFPLKSYNPHNPLIKLLPSHHNMNITLENVTDPIKSPSQGQNQLTGPSP